MMLSDVDLRAALDSGRLIIDPLDEKAIQPCSVDLRIGPRFLVPRSHMVEIIDPLAPNQDLMKAHELPMPTDLQPHVGQSEYFVLHPQQFALAATLERVELPPELSARIEGKSSLGRLGLLVHVTAGYVDPGFRGQLTLELYNVAPVPIRLYPGMRIAQLSVQKLSSPAERPYGSPGLGSKYSDSDGVVSSRYADNYKGDGQDPQPDGKTDNNGQAPNAIRRLRARN